MGFYLGKAKFASSKKEENVLLYRGLLIAILVHGFYDFVLFAVPVFGIVPALSIFPLLVWGFLHLKKNISTALNDDIYAGRTMVTGE